MLVAYSAAVHCQELQGDQLYTKFAEHTTHLLVHVLHGLGDVAIFAEHVRHNRPQNEEACFMPNHGSLFAHSRRPSKMTCVRVVGF